ncbi:MAG: hypothetical protein AAF292_10790 [Pseudomonadota bacterium]
MSSSTGYLRLVILAAVLVLAGDSAWGQTAEDTSGMDVPADFDNLHQTWLENGDLQLERPIPEPPPEIEDTREPRDSSGFFRWLAQLLGSLSGIIKILFYAGLAVVVGAILYFILTQYTDIRFDKLRNRSEEPEDDVLTPIRPDEKAARSLLEEADALAQDGRFSEAVHLLLFRSIQDIQSRSGKDLPEALTSREIGNLKDLPNRPRLALKPIVDLVERSFFGGRDLRQDDWQTARSSYEDFAFGEAWT